MENKEDAFKRLSTLTSFLRASKRHPYQSHVTFETLNLSGTNIGTQGVQELFFFVTWKVSEIAELNRWHVKCLTKQTTVIWHVSK